MAAGSNVRGSETVGSESRIPVVGAAIVRDGFLLACRRRKPAYLAGQWEFPGGKVEEGETSQEALIRECEEELGLAIQVGDRLGDDVLLGTGYVLQVFWCTIADSVELELRDHDQVAWLGASDLFSVNWIEADLPLVEIAQGHLEGREELS